MLEYTINIKHKGASPPSKKRAWRNVVPRTTPSEIVLEGLDVRLDIPALLSTPSGFYKARKGEETLAPVIIQSDVYINVNGCPITNISLPPNFKFTLSYQEEYTPLSEVVFDKTKEYLIFLGSSPVYHVKAGEASNQEFEALMNSHLEYKRPYTVLCNEASVMIGIDRLALPNTVFSSLSNNITKADFHE